MRKFGNVKPPGNGHWGGRAAFAKRELGLDQVKYVIKPHPQGNYDENGESNNQKRKKIYINWSEATCYNC
jgi:hypothetical protein